MDTTLRTTTLATPRLAPPQSQWLLFAINAVSLVTLLVFLFNVQPADAKMRVGTVAADTVVAQDRVTYLDRAARAAKQQQAAQAVPTVYRHDTLQAQLRSRQAPTFFTSSARILSAGTPEGAKLMEIRKLLPAGLSGGSLQQFPSLGPASLKVVESQSLALLRQAVNWRYDSNQIPATENGLLNTLPAQVSPPERNAIGEILSTFLAPTVSPDIGATVARQHLAAAQVPPVTNTVYPGEVVVRRGDLITPSVMEKLAALGLQTRHPGWRNVTASVVFSVLVVSMLFWYLHAFHRTVGGNPRLLLLIDGSILITVAAARLVTAGHVLLPFFLPVAAAPTFAAVLLAPEASIAMSFAMAALAGWIVANSFELTLYYFFTSAAGVLAVRQVRQLKQFVLAGAYISMFGLLTALSFGLLDKGYDFSALQEYVLAAAFTGFVSSTLALGGFALLSDFFGVTTTLQLLEIGQPNQDLMRRLMVKAPGTYNHSLVLASMVERAAEEIGANSLIAKVGALYHDVGKTSNPHCFVENQLGIGNIHDELKTDESARIIRGHVGQGLRLARQHGLPRLILDAIAEHHGTMTISYFLHKARQEKDEDDIDTALYAYPGPRPQSKETALLMLADGCESAVRASKDHGSEKIKEVVQAIFEDRVSNGQLDESPLTLKDLDRVRGVFCSVLNNLYHPRIEYPELPEAQHELPAKLLLESAGEPRERA